jgi:hypothetical protein
MTNSEKKGRRILIQTMQKAETSLASRIHSRFATIGGIELAVPERSAIRPPPPSFVKRFSKH